MTVVVEDTQTTEVIPESPQNSLAPWHVRVGAFAVDVLPGCAVVATMALVSFTVPPRGVWWWVSISVAGVAFLLVLVNRLVLPTITGWSLGRAVCGIAVVGRDGEAPGPWRLLLRDLAHLLDTASLFVGWLWPLWDSRRRTFSDILLGTEVRCIEPDERPGNTRRWTAVAVLTCAFVCVAGAVLSYALVDSRDRAIDQTRQQISVQGPKLVTQMLTYDPKSLQDDFARAQSLATDNYRPKLVEQQEIVKKGHPVVNEYWLNDAAIQSATPDRATMLLFMHGRRGEGGEERYITATVQVNFAKGGDGRWRVDDLTVLAKPKPAGNGK
ncbi:MAG: RDD family protein [Mycobacterium sp.]|uniref:RDD family protein n=1 Tax=Mycobacterium sp. TaxID=1785 RepID=UPI003C660414